VAPEAPEELANPEAKGEEVAAAQYQEELADPEAEGEDVVAAQVPEQAEAEGEETPAAEAELAGADEEPEPEPEPEIEIEPEGPSPVDGTYLLMIVGGATCAVSKSPWHLCTASPCQHPRFVRRGSIRQPVTTLGSSISIPCLTRPW